MSNYVCYHLHTEDSILDSCTNYKSYIDKAASLGQKAIGFTEHGNIYHHIAKKMYANEKGLKYIHGAEFYLTESFAEKKRDNYHTILLAKNFDGVKEINRLIDLSTRADHFYYTPRISFDEFFNVSDNVIKISACIVSPLNKYRVLIKNTENEITDCRIKEKNDNLQNLEESLENRKTIYQRLLKAYDYYEVQPHINFPEQAEYNKFLYEMSKKYNIPLIAGTDTHSLDSYKAECRNVLKKAKRIEYAKEDNLDLTYKTGDEIIDFFLQQNALPLSVITEAVENTNRMADSIADYEIDTSFKYPSLNTENTFTERVYSMYHEKLDKGIIKQDDRYEKNIKEELRVFNKLGMNGFMQFMSELTSWCRNNNIPLSPCRGSVGGSTIAYLTDITDVDPVVWGTVFSRFANEDRQEIGDIDIDVPPSKRQMVFDYIINRFGEDYTAYILSNGTVSDKATIDEIGRALSMSLTEVAEIKSLYCLYLENIKKNQESVSKTQAADEIKRLQAEIEKNKTALKNLKAKYSTLFYYFDGINGTEVSTSMHPAGIVVSPVSLPDNYGTFWSKDGKRVLCISMDEIHAVSLVKYDILALKTLDIIDSCCNLSKIPYPRSHTFNWRDKKVWEHITDISTGLFQFESKFAFDGLKTYKCKSIYDLCLVNAALRPSGESYRDRLFNGEYRKNPSAMIDKLLEKSKGWLVFQEDTIKFLTDICGLSGSQADNVRRAIGRKQKDRLDAALPDILSGYCLKSEKPREIAEKEAMDFLQVIKDGADYQFGYNHSVGYSMLTYICAYLRCYYPKEFITSYLNFASNEDDIKAGTKLAMFYGLNIHGFSFKHAAAEYSCDDTGIYKGVSSIKNIRESTITSLQELSKENITSFSDLLFRMTEKHIGDGQVEILIKTGFFKDFGGVEYLLNLQKIYLKYGGRKQLKKEDLLRDKVSFNTVRKCAVKETQKVFKVNPHTLIDLLFKDVKDGGDSLNSIVKYQLDSMGYIDVVNKKYAGYGVVTDISIDYSPKVFLYALANGNTIPIKVNKQTFYNMPLKRGDIVKVGYCYKKNKTHKTLEGWKETDVKEWWMNEYEVIRKEIMC